MPESGAARRAAGCRSFWLHLHPPRVHAATVDPRLTLGLGLAALCMLVVLTATGLVLMLHYAPTPARAHSDVMDIVEVVPFGRLCRNAHRVATHLLLIITGLHLLRVFLCAAYRGGRVLNWLVGLGLLLVVIALAFSGYLLPWDTTSYWACTVGADMLGLAPVLGPGLRRLFLAGAELTEKSLLRFYVLHVALLPALTVALSVYHLWRVRKDGGLARNAPGTGAGAGGAEPPTAGGAAGTAAMVETWPDLALREATWVVLCMALVLALGLVAEAPLGDPVAANEARVIEKAPWYLVGVQEMVSYSTRSAGVLFPLTLVVGLLLLPLADRSGPGTGQWLAATPARVPAMAAVAGLSAAAVGLWLWESLASGHGTLFDPALCVVVTSALAGLAAGLRYRRLGAAGVGLVAASLAGYLLFTAVGSLCRGPSWAFIWPWSVGLALGAGP